MIQRILGLLAVLVSIVVAQDKAPENKKDSKLSVRLLAEQYPPELGKVFLSFGEEKSEDLIIPTNYLSAPVPVPERKMILKTAGKDITLCNINLPETGKAFAVILVVAKPAGFSPIVVRTDDPSFKAGDVFFINRSDTTVLGKLGNTPLVLKSGETTKTRPTGAVEETYYDIAFATREATGDKLISTSRWPIDIDIRSYLFFFTNAEGRTTFRAVDEQLTPATAGKP
jgi:hypothetical protein